jgi:hypothetical protein
MGGTRSYRHASRVISLSLLCAAVLAACTPGLRSPVAGSAAPTPSLSPPAASVTVSPDLHVVRTPIPFPFEENRGQASGGAAYLLRAGSMRAAFGAQGVSYTLVGADADRPPAAASTLPSLPVRDGPVLPPRAFTVEQDLVGARAVPPIGTVPAPTRVTYLKGPADQWLTNLPTFSQLRRTEAWAGVDVVYERGETGLKSTYLVAPGADPRQIQLIWHGADARLAEDGTLTLETPLGTIAETAPVAWQERDGQRVPVVARWAASDVGLDETVWGFRLGAYDPTLPLVIDPTVLNYATYLGGNAEEIASGIAVDAAGMAYVTGGSLSTEATFPNGSGFAGLSVPGFDQSQNGNFDVFVVKLAADGRSLVYATFIGGTNEDIGGAIAVDGSGAAYVTGSTSSKETVFPNGTGFAGLGVPGFDQTLNNNPGSARDAFVLKLTPNGQSLAYATYIGGSGEDAGHGIAVDASGAAYVAGHTTSTDTTFPNGTGFATAGVTGFDTSYNGGGDAFVVKLAPNGQSLVYATYIGGISQEIGQGIAVDASGAACVVGLTASPETTFPNGTGFATAGVTGFDTFYNGGTDAFVVKLGPNGRTLNFATYLGGNGDDLASGIAVDSFGAAYIAGQTGSTEATFPNGGGLASLGVPGFDQAYNGGPADAYIVKLGPTGSTLVYATYLGGSSGDSAVGIAVDSSGAAYVAGETSSTQASFPNGGGLAALGVPGFDQAYNDGGDAFVVKLAPNGQSLADATYLGGSGDDYAVGIAVDGTGVASVAGRTTSPQASFPNGSGLAGTGAPGFDQTFNGGTGDAFSVKLGPTPTFTPTVGVCGPRPTVRVNVGRSSPGQLTVTVSSDTAPATPGNHLLSLQLTIPANAVVDVPNGAQGLTGTQRISVGAGTQPIAFVVRRTGPGAITVPLLAVDTCGSWPSFVGGGASAF